MWHYPLQVVDKLCVCVYRHVLKDLQKQINEVLVKAEKDDETQQVP